MGRPPFFSLLTKKRLIDYSITFGIEFIILIFSVVLFKLVNDKFLETGFAEYTINKRVIGFLMPLLMIGLGVSLPKFLPKVIERVKLEITYSAILLVSLLFLLFVVVLLLFGTIFSEMAFGDSAHVNMMFVIVLYVYSLMIHACIYNYFRGNFDYKKSGLLQLINLGIIPFITYFIADNVIGYFLLMSSFTFGVLFLYSFILMPKVSFYKVEWKDNLKRLINYGIQRMPGDVVLGLFFALPVFIVSNYFSLLVSGNIAFCMSLFNIIIALMSPVNIILLPEASKMVNEKNYSLLKVVLGKLLLLSLAIGLISLVTILFAGNYLLNVFGVSDIELTGKYLVVIFTGVIGFSVFSVIRSIIDAYYERARTTSLIVIAFVSFGISVVLLRIFDNFTILNILIAFSICMNLMGLLTYLSVRKIYNLKTK